MHVHLFKQLVEEVATLHYLILCKVQKILSRFFLYFSHAVMMYIFSEGIGPRTSSRGTSSVDSAATSNAVGSGKATLRLRSKGPPLVETEEVSYHLYSYS